MKKTILFVCIGNLCRSPMAEYFFNHHNKNSDWTAKSAGLGGFTDYLNETTETMKEKNIDITSHKSKKITPKMLEEAHTIYSLAPEATPHLPKEKTKQTYFQDPFYNEHKYGEIRDQIEKLVKKIIKEL